MRFEELFPYWKDVHEELHEKLEFLNEERLLESSAGAKSIRDIVLDFVLLEQQFIAKLAGGFTSERPAPSAYSEAAALIELLKTTRQVSMRVLEPLTPVGLRAVRTVPADPAENRPEANTAMGWLFWYVIQREIMCLGQVSLRIADTQSKKPGRWN